MRTKDELPECPVATAVSLIGGKWKLLLLRNLRERPWRFNELQRSLEGISQKVLTESLRQMVNDGLAYRHDYHENPPRVEYGLTELGMQMLPIVNALEGFGRYYKSVVEQAFNRACEELELAVRAPRFNFPTPEEFSARLARHGLTPVNVYAYDRPTPLKDGEQGLANWMRQFFAGQLEALPEQTGQALLARAEELARPELWDGDHWTADYRRLRAVAQKPAE